MYVGKVGRITAVEIVPNTINEESFPLPEEIVVMGDRVDPGFGDKFRQGHTERNVERYSYRVFRYEYVDLELLDELVERRLDLPSVFMKRFGEFLRAIATGKTTLIGIADLRFLEVK